MKYAWLVAITLFACGPRAPRPPAERGVPWARSGIDWRKAPAVHEVAWTAPAIAEATLDNGIRIVVVENHRLPLVAVRVLHTAAGSAIEDPPGLASLTVDLLVDGAPGVRFETAIATDHAAQLLVTRSRELAPAFAQLARMLRRPTFDERAFTRMHATRLAETIEHHTQTRRIAARIFDRVVFGAHPYAEPAEGTVRSVRALTREGVRSFSERQYRPDAMTIIVAGDTTLTEVRELASQWFDDWKAPASPLPAVPALPAYKASVAYVDVPGARETNVIVGRRASAVGDPQLLASEVANAILGGGVDGRLDRELHGKLALTFGASSSFWRGAAGGSWAAAATFDVANTAAGIRALLGLTTARTTPPTSDELAAARRDLLAAARSAHDTTTGTARAVERLVLQRQPLDSHATLAARLATVSAAQARDALPLADLTIVIVGDWSRIRDGLAELGAATPYQP